MMTGLQTSITKMITIAVVSSEDCQNFSLIPKNYMIHHDSDFKFDYSESKAIFSALSLAFPFGNRFGYWIAQKLLLRSPFKVLHSKEGPQGGCRFRILISKNDVFSSVSWISLWESLWVLDSLCEKLLVRSPKLPPMGPHWPMRWRPLQAPYVCGPICCNALRPPCQCSRHGAAFSKIFGQNLQYNN